MKAGFCAGMCKVRARMNRYGRETMADKTLFMAHAAQSDCNHMFRSLHRVMQPSTSLRTLQRHATSQSSCIYIVRSLANQISLKRLYHLASFRFRLMARTPKILSIVLRDLHCWALEVVAGVLKVRSSPVAAGVDV